jgi:uncharacterized membrane protein YccF (DUF307 family)
MGLLYTLLVGVWLCIAFVTVGLLLCITVVGIPFGVTMIALGFKYLTLPNRRWA